MLYNILIYIVQPIILIKLLWKSINNPKYLYKINERYGFYNKQIKQNGIIIHAVSLGETLSVIPLIKKIEKTYPKLPIIITNTTITGIQQAQSILKKNIYNLYFPFDLPGAIKRFLNHTKPIIVIIMETEIWPNLIRILYYRHIPCILINARLSDKSMKNYKKINNFIVPIIKCITLVAAQHKQDGLRFIKLGLNPKKLIITGNLKFDIPINTSIIKQSSVLRKKWAKDRPTWIAASTHQGEEEILLQTHKTLLKIFPDLLMILVPRHPDRCITIKKMITKYNLNYISHNENIIPSINTKVVIHDAIGKLIILYGMADLAFIGGSLVNCGGHNPLEAAAHSIPIITGPYVFNFQNVYHKLNQLGGCITINHTSSLVTEISTLLNNNAYRILCGKKANEYLKQNKGALNKLLYLLKPYLNKQHNKSF